MGVIFDELAPLSEDQIRSFDPIYPNLGPAHKRIAATCLHPTKEQVDSATRVRESSSNHRKRMLKNLPKLHQKHKNQREAAKNRGEVFEGVDWNTVGDSEHDLFLREDAPYRQWLIREVGTDGNGKPRTIAAASGDSMFDAAWDNPMLRRFLKLQALVNLGYGQKAWADPKLNKLPKLGSDDWPDLSLVLYARDGDTILTADNIKDRIRLIDPENKVRISTWEEWLKQPQ